ncbi:MAG: tRNA 2-thiouridine(34) synthase MnmA [Deltaproteobacteria bacterium]|nr:tRNA 2-thiouridine(34) synthase MnmA [Deltaproteobacteria bacterium]
MIKTAILLSGGVDSLVAAHLLKQRGHAVVGIHFMTGFEKPCPAPNNAVSSDAAVDAHAVASRTAAALATQLNIAVEVMDCRTAFKTRVVDYFTRTYTRGKTPNPCLVCNPAIKFGQAFVFAQTLGADKIATGHYARTRVDRQGFFRLLRGKDPAKDQSYFLARLSQKNLSRAIFPLGDMTKVETVNLAREQGLRPITPQESQDICFIREGRYSEFLMQQPGFDSSPGPIKDIDGNVIGQHPGLHLFTIGQRRGINCPAHEPYYVIDIDAAGNCLTVGHKKDTLARECRVQEINWIHSVPTAPIDVRTRIRYRHQAAPSLLIPAQEGRALVRFRSPVSAITPGQGAVFYSGDDVLGGGWIV